MTHNGQILVISSSSAAKDDSIVIPSGWKVVDPSHYLDDRQLLTMLVNLRKIVFSDPRADVGKNVTYAFDLYVRKGRAYKDLFKHNYSRIKELLVESDIVEWFFLSGGFGIIHALEKAHRYQATFNYNIAHQRNIPYTGKIWNGTLVKICDHIFSKFTPTWVYVFGSRDYTNFIRRTRYWKKSEKIKIFESTGTSGPNWISPILNELVTAIIENRIEDFNAKYEAKFIKQSPRK